MAPKRKGGGGGGDKKAAFWDAIANQKLPTIRWSLLNAGVEPTPELKKELIGKCRSEIGAFAGPDTVHWAPALPKTRSGKIMRRILRKIAAAGKEVSDEELGDTSTLADTAVVQQLIDAYGA